MTMLQAVASGAEMVSKIRGKLRLCRAIGSTRLSLTPQALHRNVRARHLSGCWFLKANFCASATVSMARPARKPASAAHPHTPSGAVGATTCVTHILGGWLRELVAEHMVVRQARALQTSLALCAALSHLCNCDGQQHNPAPQRLSCPEAGQLDGVPARPNRALVSCNSQHSTST